jgi:hypothetical protein
MATRFPQASRACSYNSGGKKHVTRQSNNVSNTVNCAKRHIAAFWFFGHTLINNDCEICLSHRFPSIAIVMFFDTPSCPFNYYT